MEWSGDLFLISLKYHCVTLWLHSSLFQTVSLLLQVLEPVGTLVNRWQWDSETIDVSTLKASFLCIFDLILLVFQFFCGCLSGAIRVTQTHYAPVVEWTVTLLVQVFSTCHNPLLLDVAAQVCWTFLCFLCFWVFSVSCGSWLECLPRNKLNFRPSLYLSTRWLPCVSPFLKSVRSGCCVCWLSGLQCGVVGLHEHTDVVQKLMHFLLLVRSPVQLLFN